MPQPGGDRFSNFNMADCAFCPPERRGFRTGRVCEGCGRPLCVVCRPWSPGQAFRCAECGGGALEDALGAPDDCIRRREEAGQPVPFWLTVLRERARVRHENPADTAVPE